MTEELIGIIGGSGLGDSLAKELSDVSKEEVETPFGKPSGAILVGKMGTKKIAFINRHGDEHILGPSEVPYAANIFAIKKLGVTAIIASGAVGSLQEKIKPKELVVVDQFIDKTFRRQGSFFASFGAVHCELSHPTCGRLGKAILAASNEIDTTTHGGGGLRLYGRTAIFNPR